MLRSYLALVLAGGCGRLAFDELPHRDAAADSSVSDALPSCIADGFDAGTTTWTNAVGMFAERPGEGPDGSTAFGTAINSVENLVTHSSLQGIGIARVEVDFAIDNVTTGDFNVLFLTGILGPDEDGYEVGFFPTTGDNPVDEVGLQQGGTLTLIGQHEPTIEAATWHHAVVVRERDGSIHVELDGLPYMEGPPDATLSPPFTLAFRLFNQGRIDNVRVDCAP